ERDVKKVPSSIGNSISVSNSISPGGARGVRIEAGRATHAEWSFCAAGIDGKEFIHQGLGGGREVLLGDETDCFMASATPCKRGRGCEKTHCDGQDQAGQTNFHLKQLLGESRTSDEL